MIRDPMRLLDSSSDDLRDLRDALNEARALAPDPDRFERISRNVEAEVDSPPDVAASVIEDLDAERRDPDRVDPHTDPLHRSALTSEAEFSDASLHTVEAEVGGGFAAGLLAAGAAVVWLRRRNSGPPEAEDEDEDEDESSSGREDE